MQSDHDINASTDKSRIIFYDAPQPADLTKRELQEDLSSHVSSTILRPTAKRAVLSRTSKEEIHALQKASTLDTDHSFRPIESSLSDEDDFILAPPSGCSSLSRPLGTKFFLRPRALKSSYLEQDHHSSSKQLYPSLHTDKSHNQSCSQQPPVWDGDGSSTVFNELLNILPSDEPIRLRMKTERYAWNSLMDDATFSSSVHYDGSIHHRETHPPSLCTKDASTLWSTTPKLTNAFLSPCSTPQPQLSVSFDTDFEPPSIISHGSDLHYYLGVDGGNRHTPWLALE